MTSRALMVALGVSVAVNLFAAATGVTLLVTRAKVEDKVAEQTQPGRGSPAAKVLRELDPEVRERVADTLRQSALAARPDFREARLKRRQATALAAAPQFDPAEVRALLEESRQAELRGRMRVETDAVALLASLSPEDRSVAAAILAGRNARRNLSQGRVGEVRGPDEKPAG